MQHSTHSGQQQIIEENAAYVLGMYDMYDDDKEIARLLKMKGLDDSMVQKVLHRIREPAYRKRIRQSKILMLTGVTMLVALVLIPYLLVQFYDGNAAELPLTEEQFYIKRERVGGLTTVAYNLLKIAAYLILFGIAQLGLGIYSFVRYTGLLKEAGTSRPL